MNHYSTDCISLNHVIVGPGGGGVIVRPGGGGGGGGGGVNVRVWNFNGTLWTRYSNLPKRWKICRSFSDQWKFTSS